MSEVPIDKEGLSMLWWAAWHPPADPTTSFAGKTILITGANIGLGYEAAVKFALHGASKLIFGVRSLQRGEDAKASLCRKTGYNPANIKLYQLDMGTFASIDAFASLVTKETPQIDIALLNAGIAAAGYNLSPEGYEMSLQVNVISTALLGILLLPKLRETAATTGQPAHLELVGSASHREIKPETFKVGEDENVLAKATSKEFFNVQQQYAVTKLLLIYVMQGLAANTL